MDLRKTLAAAAIGAAALACAGAGRAATTLYLDVDGCAAAGGCGLTGYGTVTVTAGGSFTDVLINLAPNVYFARGDNGLDAAAFDVVGSPTLATTGISNFFGTASPHTALSFSEGALGTFQYVVDWAAGAGQGPLLQQLDFHISTNNLPVSLNPVSTSGTAVYLSVDIQHTVNGVVKEGVVGGSLNPPAPSVPEPAAWALMLTGFLGMGTALRRRRAAPAVT